MVFMSGMDIAPLAVMPECGRIPRPNESVNKMGDNAKLIDSSLESKLFLDAAKRGAAYLEAIRERSVAPAPQAIADLVQLGGRLPEAPQDAAEVLELLDRFGSPATIANAGGRYFGFVCGGAVPASRAANVLAAAWDQNAAMRVLSPVAAALEDISLGWLLEVLGLPASSGGAFVTGATAASFTCLAAARHSLLEQQGWQVEADGLFGAPPIAVYVSDQVHTSVLKALAMLGLGRERVTRLPTDAQGRIRATELPALSKYALLCIQAGDVNSGAFDPAPELCAWAHEAAAWVHVDGAFGLWAAVDPARAGLMAGFASADSWATDAHKWLNVPYDCGLAFVRHRESLRASMSARAAYLQLGEEREPTDWGPELSRRARGVEVWAALRSLGRSGLGEMVGRNCRQAERFATRLTAAGYSILNDVVLNQVLVSFGTDELTRQVVLRLQEDGTCWCGSTVWKGQTSMRISVSSWATTDEDVERSASAMIRIAQSCSDEAMRVAGGLALSFRSFEPGDAADFASLNEAWIAQFFTIEAEDRRLLGDPEGEILAQGGRILFALLDGEKVGTAALILTQPGVYELGKMAVREDLRGRGVGRQLLARMLAEAVAIDATRVFLHTNSRLENAIHLYEALGFEHISKEQASPNVYARSDVEMEMILPRR